MSLPTPSLDDRTFQNLVDEAKRRIPELAPEWTDHNVSDPGVALIELFAWMTETLLYRINQVPDRMYVKFLELMGVSLYAPSPAQALLTFRLSAPQEEAVRVPAGIEVATLQTAEHEAVVFHTRRDLRVRPPRLIAALTGSGGQIATYTDRWDDLRFERQGMPCFADLRVGSAAYFGFQETLADNIVHFEMVASGEGVGVRPDDPPIIWEASHEDQWVPLEVLADTTGGLNRSGVVELQLPPEHAGVTLSGHRAHWIRVRLLAPRAGQAEYRRSPEIRTLVSSSVGGSIPALHGERILDEIVGHSDGTPSQLFRVQEAPVLPREEGQTIVVRPEEGEEETWEEVADFGRSGPQDRHFTWDGASGEIRFGPRLRQADGTERQHGAVPVEGAELRVTSYLHGGGRTGNVAPNQLTVLRTTIPFVDTVTNRRAAIGGVDGERIEQAKARGPATIRSGQRAVTASDFELIAAEASRQVSRARALPPVGPGAPVRLLIVPAITVPGRRRELRDVAIPGPLYEAVREHIEPRRLLGMSVEIGTPRYLGVSVVARVEVQAGRDAELTRQRAMDTLYSHLDPVTGGPDGHGWPWDAPLTVSYVVALLSAVEGVVRVQDVLLFEADEQTGERAPQGLTYMSLEPDALWFPVRHLVM